MLKLYKPNIDDLWFRQQLLNDKETMSFNNAYGGTINFSKDKWNSWYTKWFDNNPNYFYRYLINGNNDFVGEVAYKFDETRNVYILNIIIHNKYRHNGYGKQGIRLLCKEATNNGICEIYDDIAIDNTSIELFKDLGFIEVYRTNEYIMVKKQLQK